ncbi:glycosyltransferase family 9 protein [Candidatus Saganbacteria bacterium]|nr:glycosyltransferase family 9 protein [Candidatus Saganbacteria bacterium]
MKLIKAYPKKILLIRPEMMGDTILLTPIASAIKSKFPKTKVYILLQHPMEEIIKNNSDFDGFMLKQDFIPMLNEVKKEAFDLAINFEDNPRPEYALLMLLAGIPHRIGDKNRLLYGWIYNYGVYINSGNDTKHHIELYSRLLGSLGITECDFPLRIDLDKSADSKISSLLPPKDIDEKFIGIHIGTGGGNRALLPETYAKISDLLQEKLSCKVFLFGGEREKEMLTTIKNYTKDPHIDLVANLSIQELFSAISKMDVFIGVDSGPMHAAAALKVPVAAIYTANDVKPIRWSPWMDRNIIIRSKNDCKLKCSHRECTKNYCLEVIKPEELVAAAKELLK